MMQIKRRFKTLKQAERFQNSLYNKYPSVELIQFPIITDDGEYVWTVSM